MKKQTNFRLDAYTIELLKEFSERSNKSQADLIQFALYQLYYEFNRDPDKLTKAACGFEMGKDYFEYKKLQKKVFKEK